MRFVFGENCPRTKPRVRGRQTKKGRRGNATDLGIVEWRIPVGRAERTGDREGERETQVQTGTLTREGNKRTMERERKTGEWRREPEKREGKRKAEGPREGVERKQAGKAREVTTTTAATFEDERKRGGGTGKEAGGPAHCTKNGRVGCAK
jgi:hypothetical protein